MILPRPPAGEACQDLSRHVLGLVVLVHGGIAHHLIARAVLGPQLLSLPALVIADDGVGRLQDLFCGAVILLQADDPRPLVLIDVDKRQPSCVPDG